MFDNGKKIWPQWSMADEIHPSISSPYREPYIETMEEVTPTKKYYYIGGGAFFFVLIGMMVFVITPQQSSSPPVAKTAPTEIPHTLGALRETYNNPFDEESSYENPFSESETYTNPFAIDTQQL